MSAAFLAGILSLVLGISPTLLACASRGVPPVVSLLRSHAMFAPSLCMLLIPRKMFRDLEVEHMLRHLSYAMSASVSGLGVEPVSWDNDMVTFYIAMQVGLYLFTVTHLLEYFGWTTSHTHFGDTPVLSLLLLSIGIFLGKGGVQYVFLRTVLIAIPLRVALSTMMLLAHADFANHSTTRLEDDAFNKCSFVGVFLASLFLSFVELDCGVAAFCFLPVVTALWVMYLVTSAPLTLPKPAKIAGLVLGAPLVVTTAYLFYDASLLVALVCAPAAFMIQFIGIFVLKERWHVPTTILGAFWITTVANALDPAAQLSTNVVQGMAWTVTLGVFSWTLERVA